MRILHTSDWHLGRTFFGVDLAAAQRACLAAIVTLARAEAVDAVLIAGDVYDRAIPPPEALAAFDETVTALLDEGIRVIATSGNHDSFMRLGHGRRALDRVGLHLRTRLSDITWPIPLGGTSAAPEAVVYGVPYLEPGLVFERFGCPRTHQAVLGVALDRIRTHHAAHFSEASLIVAAHAFVGAHAVGSESERSIDVGGVSIVGAEVFDGVDYTALGHLHRPQDVTAAIRYAGSPLPYSFTEALTPKRVLLVDTADPLTVVSRELPSVLDVRTVSGSLDEVIAAAGDLRADGVDPASVLVSAELSDPVRVPGALGRLKQAYPGLIRMSWVRAGLPGEDAPVAGGAQAQRTDAEVFAGFIEHVTGAPVQAADAERFESAVLQARRETA